MDIYRATSHQVFASEIAALLNRPLLGPDVLVTQPEPMTTHGQTMLAFTATGAHSGTERTGVLMIAEAPIPGVATIVSPTPRLDFGRVVDEFFTEARPHEIHHSAIVDAEAKLGRNVAVGPYSIIGRGVVIGDDTVIMSRVVINGPARIGKRCVIKDGALVGSEAYAFVQDEAGDRIHLPQLGRIMIGDDVWVGSNSTIERGDLNDTAIADKVKIDDLVHIGNGAVVERAAMLTAGVVVSSNARIGSECWVMPNASIRSGVAIAAKAVVGLGAVVVNDLVLPGTYIGNPAEHIG